MCFLFAIPTFFVAKIYYFTDEVFYEKKFKKSML